MSTGRDNWPLMVRLALWQVRTRNTAWMFCWLSLALGIVCLFSPFRIGGLMIFAALWYYLAIRWVDQNSDWS